MTERTELLIPYIIIILIVGSCFVWVGCLIVLMSFGHWWAAVAMFCVSIGLLALLDSLTSKETP